MFSARIHKNRTKNMWERSGSVVKCLTRDRGAAGWSLTVLCPLVRHINPSLGLV